MVPAGAADTRLSPDQVRQSLTPPILPLSVEQGRCEGARAQVYWNAMNNRCGISIIGLVGRTTAETTRDPEAKRTMFDIAKSYDRLAETAAQREIDRKPLGPDGGSSCRACQRLLARAVADLTESVTSQMVGVGENAPTLGGWG